MPIILDLSNEVLHRIIQEIPGNDLLSLSLTSHWLHALCDKALKRHLTLKKYTTVSFGNYWHDFNRLHRSYSPKVHEDAKDALLLIEDIFKNPDIMEYPESMCLGCCVDVGDDRLGSNPWDDDESGIHLQQQSIITHRFSRLKKVVEECDFILEEEKDTSFTALCNPENEGVAVGLALTMLPNLKRIATQDWMRSYSSDRICPIVARIAEANQDPHSVFHNKALTNLREFFMSHRDDEGGEDVNIFIPFAMLPSMRYLGGTEISSEHSFIPYSELRSDSSLVTEINFLNSAINAEGFYGLLSGISALRKFTYHHYDLVNSDCRYEIRGIVRLLRKYAATSLQHLDIVARLSDRQPRNAEHQQCVGFLQRFTALEVIRLEEVAFQDPSLDSRLGGDFLDDDFFDTQDEGDAQEQDEFREEDGADEEDHVENENSLEQPAMNRLVDFLPVSVESLTLVQAVKDARRQKLLCGLLEERCEKLPHLRTLMFEGNDPINDATKAALEEAGLVVELRAKPSE